MFNKVTSFWYLFFIHFYTFLQMNYIFFFFSFCWFEICKKKNILNSTLRFFLLWLYCKGTLIMQDFYLFFMLHINRQFPWRSKNIQPVYICTCSDISQNGKAKFNLQPYHFFCTISPVMSESAAINLLC